jgi:hypothetical protein
MVRATQIGQLGVSRVAGPIRREVLVPGTTEAIALELATVLAPRLSTTQGRSRSSLRSACPLPPAVRFALESTPELPKIVSSVEAAGAKAWAVAGNGPHSRTATTATSATKPSIRSA